MQSRSVVRVAADEDIVVAVADGIQIVGQHARDHSVLVPEGNEDRDAALGCTAEAGRIGKREAAPRQKRDDCDEQVVQPADQDPDGDRNQAEQCPMIEGFK